MNGPSDSKRRSTENATMLIGMSFLRHVNMQRAGETLTLTSRDTKTDYRVAGVVEDLPRNSHVSFDIVALSARLGSFPFRFLAAGPSPTPVALNAPCHSVRSAPSSAGASSISEDPSPWRRSPRGPRCT